MEGLLLIVALLGGLGVAFYALYDWSHQSEDGGRRLVWAVATLPLRLVGLLFRGGRGALESSGVALPSIFGPPRSRDPQKHQFVKRKTADPMRPGGAEHGSWPYMGQAWPAAHFGLAGESRSGKGQGGINHIIRHQLLNSPEHLIINDVKPELEGIVKRYARPDDRIFLYTTHANKRKSSALNLFGDLDTVAEMMRVLTRPEDSKEPFWARKAAGGLSETARHLHRQQGGGAVSLGEIYDIVSNRDRLNDLRDRAPAVDNVADNPSEWGSIRSNMLEALEPIGIPRVRRMLDPLPQTTQPYFGPGAPRTIVILQPAEELGGTLEPVIAVMLHVLYHLAAAGGWAGGAGTKVIADEAASFMALHRLPKYLELGAGRKVQLMYVLQSRKQLVDALGDDTADRVLSGTELQALGATTDTGAADFFERLSGPARVQYRGPRNPNGDRPWQDHMRPKVQAHEITAQARGDWTVRHHADIHKYRVPEAAKYGQQLHPDPKPLRVHGIPKR